MNPEDRPDPLAPPEGYGAAARPEPAHTLDLPDPAPTCAQQDTGQPVCARPTAWRIIHGDTSEHLAVNDVCEQHARRLSRPTATTYCGHCGKVMEIVQRTPLPTTHARVV